MKKFCHEVFTIGVYLQIKSFWTVLWLTVTSRNSSSSSLTVHICCLLLLWCPFHVFFHLLVSVVSVSLFKPYSVSAFFLFFRCSLSAPTSSSYLDQTVFRDLCSLFVPGFALCCDLCCIFHALCPCLLKGGKKALLFFNVCLSLFITVGWCWVTRHLTVLECTWIISCGWKIKAWLNSLSLIVINHEFELWLRLSLVYKATDLKVWNEEKKPKNKWAKYLSQLEEVFKLNLKTVMLNIFNT